MEDMQNQMNAILSNPEMMEKIMTMAQSLNQTSTAETSPPPNGPSLDFSPPDIDLAMVQKLSGFIGQGKIDNNQRTLLNALSPYLSNDRIYRLEKAMRAGKIAAMASNFLNSSGFRFNIGR